MSGDGVGLEDWVRMEGMSTRLFYSLHFEHILHHFKMGDKSVFMLGNPF
jgi:hypothetical protein